MFNLPFPTDSLYKFAFIFGLVMLIYSFYYYDGHLNKFDSHQAIYKRDSLIKRDSALKFMINENRENIAQFRLATETDIPFTINKTKEWCAFLKTDLNYDTTSRQFQGRFDLILNYKDTSKIKIIKMVNDLYSKISIKNGMDRSNTEEEIPKVRMKTADFVFNFRCLFCGGILLFISGGIAWYVMIQRPQDAILKKQKLDAIKIPDEPATLKDFKTGTHFEPQVLPRPYIRYRR